MKLINLGMGDYNLELTKQEVNALRFLVGTYNECRVIAEAVTPETRSQARNVLRALCNPGRDIDVHEKN